MASSTFAQVREQFMLIVGGIPPSWKWEELKDFAKQTTERVRADVAPYPCSGVGGSQQVGFVTVNGREDAARLHSVFENSIIERRRVSVHCFDVTDGSKATLLACNCAALGLAQQPNDTMLSSYVNPNFQLWQAPYLSNAAPCLPMGLFYGYINDVNPAVSPSLVSSQAFVPIQGPSIVPVVYGLLADPFSPNMGHPSGMMYHPGWNGAPINTTYGYYETESRSVHISQLNFATSEQDLEGLLRRAGSPASVTINRNLGGKSKGSAVAQLQSRAEAQRAIEMLDGFKFMGRRIRVKVDRDASAGPVPPSRSPSQPRDAEHSKLPIVVNGSTSRRSSSASRGESQ